MQEQPTKRGPGRPRKERHAEDATVDIHLHLPLTLLHEIERVKPASQSLKDWMIEATKAKLYR